MLMTTVKQGECVDGLFGGKRYSREVLLTVSILLRERVPGTRFDLGQPGCFCPKGMFLAEKYKDICVTNCSSKLCVCPPHHCDVFQFQICLIYLEITL